MKRLVISLIAIAGLAAGLVAQSGERVRSRSPRFVTRA